MQEATRTGYTLAPQKHKGTLVVCYINAAAYGGITLSADPLLTVVSLLRSCSNDVHRLHDVTAWPDIQLTLFYTGTDFIPFSIWLRFSYYDIIISLNLKGILRGSTFDPSWLDTGSYKFPGLDEEMLAVKGAPSFSPAKILLHCQDSPYIRWLCWHRTPACR